MLYSDRVFSFHQMISYDSSVQIFLLFLPRSHSYLQAEGAERLMLPAGCAAHRSSCCSFGLSSTYVVFIFNHQSGKGGEKMSDLKTQLNRFELYLREDKALSENTVISYCRDIRQFSEWLEQDRTSQLNSASKEDISSYLQYLQGMGKSPSTVSRSAASLKRYFTYLMEKGTASLNPAAGIALEKHGRKLPSILTNHEVDLFLSQPDQTDPKGIRDKAMLELLYASGIRVSELIGLNLEDINLSVGFLVCRTGEKERVIPLYKVAVKSIQEYLQRVRPILTSDNGETALFVNVNGSRMSRQGFWKIASLLCGSSAGKRCRYPGYSGDAWACRSLYHADLYQSHPQPLKGNLR